MRLVSTLTIAAGLTLAASTTPARAQQESCQARLAALDSLLAERHPGLFPTKAAPAAASTKGALSGDPPLSTETPTAKDVPTSAMPGAGPEIELTQEGQRGKAAGEETASRPSKEGPTGTSLSQREIDRVATLRTLAEERLSAGKEDECRAAVDQARGGVGG